jgi:hypothetical protein
MFRFNKALGRARVDLYDAWLSENDSARYDKPVDPLIPTV